MALSSSGGPLHRCRGHPRIERDWRSDIRVFAKGEWAYSQADPGFLVEERMGPIPGTPSDFKVYVFDGEPYMILVDSDRFGVI